MLPNHSDKVGAEFIAGGKDWVLRRRWLKELTRRSRKVSDTRLLCGSGIEVVERKLKMIRNKFHRIEKLFKDNISMDSGGQGRIKKDKKIRGRLGTKKDTSTVPRQRCQKACWVF